MKMFDKKRKNQKLIWVYPPNNWTTSCNKTFVYGSSDPKAKLFVEAGKQIKIKVFPNGNFAKSIKLSQKKNRIKLIQILNRKRNVLTRNINVKKCRDAPLGRLYGGKSQMSLLPRNNKVIVIDPGHGGKEHGTHSPKGVPEKVYNLQIAKMFPRALHATPLRAKIYLTRSTDKFVSLKDRVNFAKKKKCNLFISIHHNALPDNEDPIKHTGIGVYYMHDFVKPFAKRLLESICKETKMRKYGVFKRDFAVTRPSFYKGILIECGFLIHPLEAEYVTRKKNQEKIVKGIIRAIGTIF